MSTIKTTNITHGSNSGTANMVLASDGKVTFGNTGGLGKLLQVVTASSNTSNASPSANATWTDMAPTASITPSSTSSKIICILSVGITRQNLQHMGIRLIRGSTTVRDWFSYDTNGDWTGDMAGLIHIDSPSTTSAITYKYQLFATINSGQALWNYQGPDASNSERNAEVYLAEIGP